MKILFLGDVVGRSGRDAVVKHLPTLRAELQNAGFTSIAVAVVSADQRKPTIASNSRYAVVNATSSTRTKP